MFVMNSHACLVHASGHFLETPKRRHRQQVQAILEACLHALNGMVDVGHSLLESSLKRNKEQKQ